MRKFLLVLLVALAAAFIYQMGHRAGQSIAEQQGLPGSKPAVSASASTTSSRSTASATASSRSSTRSSPADSASSGLSTVDVVSLPREARKVLDDIRAGGPFDYPRDGVTFQNRERVLPIQSRGYYREYTVRTPGENDRGARRIVTGGKPASEFYYTDDHYRSFKRIRDVP
ncbi:ribonuclease domain-containing protein [Luteimonas sp. FXH3W]|uniref:Ribonuclease domain-containing protein n=1 Tax=Aquilutibacter rugosus TaxID=3115820 RepID=A0ABU7UXM6_9GAMM